MLRRCIPEYRLPKKLVDFDIMCITDLGVRNQNQHRHWQKSKNKKAFKEGYDAIFIATGAHKRIDLNIKGARTKRSF